MYKKISKLITFFTLLFTCVLLFANQISTENIRGESIEFIDNINSLSNITNNPEHALEEPKSLWKRIEAGFKLENQDSKREQDYMKWYQSRPEYVERMIDRSSKYLYHVVEEVEKRNMPMEIALLPMIESAYNPVAKSRQKAVGMWQFIASTGRLYGLEQDWWQDKRRNVIQSTSAALDYLEKLHQTFGSWELALAAYNAGEGRIKRAIIKNTKRKRKTDYYSLDLPRETKNYVPKLMAIKKIIMEPEKFQLFIQNVPDAPYFKVVNVPDEIDAAVAANMAQISLEEFQSLNPEHNRPLLKTKLNSQDILLPITAIETFKENLEKNTNSLTQWIIYEPIKGEKVSYVAKKFGIDIKSLTKINQLRSNENLKNKIILIPNSPEALDNYPINMDSLYSYSTIVTHKVKKGETLSKIALIYNIPLKDLMEFNELKSAKIIVGSYIDIPK